MLQHGTKLGHYILLRSSGTVTKESAHVDWIITDVADIELHSKKEVGFSLNRSLMEKYLSKGKI
jgi:hypothetical protein